MKITTCQKSCKKIMIMVLVFVMMLNIYLTAFADTTGTGSEVSALTYDITNIDSYVPDGLGNIALNKPVTSTSSYEKANEGWCNAFLTDGILGKAGAANGWTTNPYDKITDATTPAAVQVDLGADYALSRVVLFPRSDYPPYGLCFPSDFIIQLSSDGVNYTDAYTSAGNGIPVEPFVIDLPEKPEARYVKLYVTKRYDVNMGINGKLVQLSEIAVFGKISKISASLNKTDLLLIPGVADTLVPDIIKDDTQEVNLTWESSDTSVAAVDQNGVVTAVAAGNATVTAKDESNGISLTCSVIVKDKIKRSSDNILISIFWPPTKDYVNDEQYSYLADANITYIQNVTGNDLNEKETNLEMARLAYKYGMQVGVADSRFGGNLLNMTDEEIMSLAGEYKNIPGVGGYYILDEPHNANPYARVFKAFKNADTYGYAHLNFLPLYVYSSVKEAENQMNDWVKLASQSNCKLDYLIYDRYPFGMDENTLDYTGFLNNLSSTWKVGLKNGVKTGTYIQSIGVPGNFRRTNENEIRYEAYMALAYGYKQLSYFCWFTPTGRSETFTDAIITADGKKTDLFEPVKKLNGEILKMGPTLMNLDARKIYFNGNTYGQETVPDNFFVHSLDNNDLTFSYMRDKNTGRNYLMVVNNSFTEERDVSLKFADGITGLQEVSKDDGTHAAVALTDGILNMHFAKGDGHLFALPENFDYQGPAEEPAARTNLALDAQVYCETSQGSDGWYMANLNDGIRFSDGSTSNGWQSSAGVESSENSITLDLGTTHKFNRIDLYPAGELLTFADYMPKDFSIDVSEDASTWTTVKTVTDMDSNSYIVPSYSFDSVTARYVRISIAEMAGINGRYAASLSEIEVYNDDGTVPATESPLDSSVVEYTPGMNIALSKKVYVSSSTPDSIYKQWGWSADYVNDGLSGVGTATCGWTSNVKINTTETANEWVAIYFGDLFNVNQINVSPTLNGAFPYDYTIELSENGKNWVTVKEVTGDVPGNSSLREFVLDKPVAARFIRMTGTKLKLSGADGYLMQVGEIEAYGSPICNKTSLNEAITSAESASADNYSKEVFSSIQELVVRAKELSGSEYTTQTVADDMTCKILAALATTLPNSTPNRKVGVPATALASVTVNNEYTLELSTIFEDADSDPLTYWVSVNGAPKVAADEDYSYTPAAAGLFTLTFTANDGTADSTDTYTVTLTVADTPQTNPTIASITPVDNVEVPYGTEEAAALAALADTTIITDSGNSTHTVNLSWTIDGYDSNTTGGYTATGTFTLPAGVDQSNPATLLEVTAIVTVRQAINAAISPTTVAFDPDSPGDVSTTVTWGSAAAVTGVVYGTMSLASPVDYYVSGNTLTITAGYLEGLNLSAGDTAEFEISFNVGDSATLAVEAVKNYKPGSDATLSDLTVGGSTVSGFMPGTYTCSVKLPHGTLPGSAAATVGATPSDPKATINIIQAASLPGSATVLVTAEDKATIQTYTVNFTFETVSNKAPKRKTGVPATTSASVTVNAAYTLDLLTIFEDTDSDPLAYTVSVDGASPVAAAASFAYIPVSAGDIILVFKANDGTADSDDTYTVTLTASAAPPKTYALTITAGTGGSTTTGSSNYAAGTVINIAATPSSGYSFNKWTSDGGGTFGSTTSAGTTFTMPANAVTITASFTYNGSGGGSGSHTSTPSYKADVSGTGTSGTTLPVNVNTNNGNASVDLRTPTGDIFTDGGAMLITVPSIPGVDTYALGISASFLTGSQGEGSLTFTTGMGSITIPDNMLSGIPGTEGKKAGITIGQGDKSGLPDEVKTSIGNRPLVQFTLALDGTQTEWDNPSAPVTVSIPYTPTAEELADPEHIVVWYIDGAGNAVSVPNGRYDPATGAVNFTTTHFSYYAIAYVQKTFGDLGSVAWAKGSIEVLASKGILEGTSETEYSPQTNITRADFLCFLVRTLGVDAEVDGNFDDISSDDYYYKEIGIAKALGITRGIGNNKFSPDSCITRQDMMVLSERALRMLKKLEAQGSASDLGSFTDKSLVASYAVNSVASVVKEGLIVGSGNKVNPLGNTTRAEAAVFLYRVYNKYAGY